MDQAFFARSTETVAKELLGSYIDKPPFRVRIVETEAYLPENDPASHAAQNKTERNATMFGPPGHAYIYICYGIHTMFNIVTEQDGRPGAVLVRAAEPVTGQATMSQNREIDEIHALCNGPGKLCEAIDITREQDGEPLYTGEFCITAGDAPETIDRSTRIGISDGTDMKLRFLDPESPCCSSP